jgi:hypothetical protein
MMSVKALSMNPGSITALAAIFFGFTCRWIGFEFKQLDNTEAPGNSCGEREIECWRNPGSESSQPGGRDAGIA